MGKSEKEFKSLMKTLKKLPLNIQKNVVNGAVRAATVVIKNDAKANAPKISGNLEASLTVRKRRSKDKRRTVYAVSVTYGSGAKHDAYYASFVEFGTRYIKANPFMRRAAINKADQSVDVARKYIKKRLPKEVRKLKGFL